MRAKVTHACGHEEEQELRSYDSFKKTTRPIPELAGMGAPAVVAEANARLVARAIRFQESRLCSACWKTR